MARTVYVVDDDALARDWLEETITLLPDVRVEQMTSGHELLAGLDSLENGVVLIDLAMPGLTGIETLAKYRENVARFPTILMSAQPDIRDAVAAMRLGALDFLEKPCSPRDLFDKLRMGFDKIEEQQRADEAQADLVERFASLSERERQVLEQLIDGRVNREIAAALDLSVRTVEVYRAKLMMKLGVSSLAEAVTKAISAGFAAAPAGA
ncbi:response regulator [Sphingomonas sp.]|uniref:response regulator transcription factor n=1 Tax=Sphingomonas sp. TaxID=28214 RepID=UPI001D325BDA|nr:response regulator [Sphingomonas sp.]MBX9797098.1 response regulator [Sphingomonas sp.]